MTAHACRRREAVILAGGFGTRLAHIVNDVPKPMAPVAGRPFMRYILDYLAENRFERIVIADGYKREIIENYFGDCYRGMELVYSPEDEPLYTGGAVKKALGYSTAEWVYVLNGDTFQDVGFDDFECGLSFDDDSTDCYIACRTLNDIERYGSIDVDKRTGKIRCFNEKASRSFGTISSGLYLIRRNALRGQPDRFSLETDYFEQVVEKGLLAAKEVAGDFIDIGIPEDYKRAQAMLAPRFARWRLAIFDRDGTINVDTGHLFEPEKLSVIPEIIPILRDYSYRSDWKVVVATNQAGIAKGLYSVDDMHKLHDLLDAELAKFGVTIDAYYYCPHHPDYTGPCDCRKPGPGMLLKALFDYDAAAEQCIMYGDKPTDAQAAESAGVPFKLVNW